MPTVPPVAAQAQAQTQAPGLSPERPAQPEHERGGEELPRGSRTLEETPGVDWSSRRPTSAPTVPRARPSAWRLGELHRFWAACGPTDGCAACRQPQGNHHSVRCLDRRARWLDETVGQKRPATEENQGEPGAIRQKVELALPMDDEEMATAEPVIRDQKMPEAERPSTDMDDSMTASRKREREGDEEEAAKEEFEARVAERCLAPVSPAGLPWLDSRTGEVLDPKLVDIGMKNEMQSMTNFKVFTEVPDTEPGEAGKKPISAGIW